ncbi:MAG: (2Fe-2S) ferredoxin domain-containing protein, partial [Acutalibacteraceae bacterium]
MKSLEELTAVYNKVQSEIALRIGGNATDGIQKEVLICGGTGCTSSHSMQIADAMEKEIAACGLADSVKVVRTGCFGLCALGPIMIVYPEGAFYSMITEEDVKEIVHEHL